MSLRNFLIALGLVLILVCPGISRSQTTQSESLGDFARRQRGERAQETRKAAKVYTNDNMPAGPKTEGRTMATGIATQAVAPSDKKTETTSSSGGSESSDRHDQKYFRSRMSELQHRLDIHKRELETMQQKLGLNQTQFYNDPNKTLQQEFNRTDINKLNGDINKKKEQIAQDEKDMDDLRDQLRREGGDPGWIR